MGSATRAPVVIVGAGQAGLAMASMLVRRGLRPQRDFMLLDAVNPDGLAWRRRWDSLRLFTPAWYSQLPGLPFAGDPAAYPLGSEMADYLDRYRERLGVVPMWRVHVTAVSPVHGGKGIAVSTSDGELAASSVVAASGPFATPAVPDFAHRLEVTGLSLHSDNYRRPAQLPPGNVLVVGAGNTGLQIARELATTHCVSVSHGRRQLRLPQQFLGADIFRWLKVTGALALPSASRMGARMSRTETVIGPGLDDLASRGVHVLPRVVDASGSELAFEDQQSRSFDSVVWATGYRPGFSWLPDIVRTGGLRHPEGQTSMRGLYVLGVPWMRNRASALIGGVGVDADRIARSITKLG